MRGVRGMTLVEVIVASVLIGVMTTVIAVMVGQGYRYFTENERTLSAFRQTSVAMNKLQAELGQCTTLYAPDPNTTLAEDKIFELTEATPLIFGYLTADGSEKVVAWYRQGADLKRREHASQGKPFNSGPPPVALGAAMTVASGVERFVLVRPDLDDTNFLLCLRATAEVKVNRETVAIAVQSPVRRLIDGL